jgi:hypothetical protein
MSWSITDTPAVNASIARVTPNPARPRSWAGSTLRPAHTRGAKMVSIHTDLDGFVIVENEACQGREPSGLHDAVVRKPRRRTGFSPGSRRGVGIATPLAGRSTAADANVHADHVQCADRDVPRPHAASTRPSSFPTWTAASGRGGSQRCSPASPACAGMRAPDGFGVGPRSSTGGATHLLEASLREVASAKAAIPSLDKRDLPLRRRA